MAKAKASPPEHGENPCSENGVMCMQRTVAPEPSKASPFLLLPAEIRLQIYSYFLLPPPKSPDELTTHVKDHENADGKGEYGSADVDRNEEVGNDGNITTLETRILFKTRRSLTLVCREIAKEWVPLFFRSSTIDVDPVKEDLENWLAEDMPMPRARHGKGLREFETKFLRTLDVSKLHNVRRLTCNAYIWYINCNYVATSRPSSVSLARIRSFGEVLDRYKDAMQSLAEVVIFDCREGLLPGMDDLEVSKPDTVRGINNDDARSIWTATNDRRTWDKIVDELQSGKCALFRGWKVNKHVSLIKQPIENFFQNDPTFSHEGHQGDFRFLVIAVQVTFRKMGDTHSEQIGSTEMMTVSYAANYD
ncbi:hypothetical protein HRR83_008126 [Exophiala dermatitidis]|uniref:Uncharacterized protein n=2 Tax=Exophiala dermatitidis TaxID=5970 RepID=H6BT47_EXODN|nr:uncharacterized protein HMPREF1120_02467 [Exophiala dermatitidis NIH/UT8656]KAJ4503370.1 hypothetical protein HRR75_008153 [Exophiala dermatitidis]EHY54297.1 hypothetical protein HMPREF1120_02467 [Exophiala dermatitidis NIH/UT8656]KAJ4505047.1 hypothetical protein HRR74_008875 [Exophiala dermatitidis]KAJ4513556.1 hypothetical protein HRR73_005714 [Exophiala dermatitidis]KAJ4535666.1 hypothetical protein HRR77_007614 [Exophiala dermatitidis]